MAEGCVTTHLMRKLLIIGIVLAACGGKKASNEPPPPQPSTGAPIAFEAKSFKPGKDRGGSVDVKAYNFSDKKVAQYWLLFRYTDAGGNVLKVKPGTPFEKDYDFMSLSGRKFTCEPKSWCSFKVDNLDVPDKTAKVEVLARSVTALKDDVKFEDKPLFELPGMDWPGDKPAGGAAPAEPGSAAPAEGGSAAAPAEGSAGSAAPAGSAAAGSAG
jgi:hypothetical protein